MKIKKILKILGGISLVSLALSQGLPLHQENISSECINPIPKNIDYFDGMPYCNTIQIPLSYDLVEVLSKSIFRTNTSGAATSEALTGSSFI